jgi:iron complex outermembrane recepter protein
MIMRSFLIVFCLFFVTFFGHGQTANVSGLVLENVLKEPVVGAKIILSAELKTRTDLDGNYGLKNVPFGSYKMIVVNSVGDTLFFDLIVDKENIKKDVVFSGSIDLQEVKVTANVVIGNRTPIAVTRISTQKISEELGSRDLPMLLSATPGVYATQSGGGDGDSRINVRGFDQRNIGVLIDGVPVNDMENGWVYWSNWFGLDNITSSVQVQRGLGVTKLAIPSVGGTLNIVTQGIGGKKGFSFKQEYGTGNLLRSSISYNSGALKNGLGVTASYSHKQSDGWVNGTESRGDFFYLKVQKKFKKHLLSLSGFMAPQEHGQRSFNQSIQYWDSKMASDLGATVDTSAIMDRGIRYNQHWGYVTENGASVVKNERLNYFNKPQVTLKDFWNINSKFSISLISYLSIGRGGGTRLSNSTIQTTEDGQIAWDAIIRSNQIKKGFGNVEKPNVDLAYSPTLLKSSQVQISSINNHYWVGF